MSATEKQYGLIDPKTSKKITANDVFGNESDSGSDHGNEWTIKQCQRDEKGIKRQTKLEMQRALEQDPTVYQYDEIYDEMMLSKEEAEVCKTTVERKPKYIQALMKSADKRKKENERRLERQIQKEREAEGDMFKDKEEFITSSYKQKLEEFKKAEEEERKMEYIESNMDVSKQQDLGGFYRNLYKETVGKENNEEKAENSVDTNSREVEAAKAGKKNLDDAKPERNYRKRSTSECNDTEEKKSKQDSSSSSSDSDSTSDSSSTSSSSDEDDKNENKENESKPKEANQNENEVNKTRGRKEEKPVEEQKPEAKIDKRDETKKNDLKDEKSNSRNNLKPIRQEEKGRRDRNYRSSNYTDRDRSSRGHTRSQREERLYRDRDKDRDRSRRDDRRNRDRRDRRRSDSRRRRRSRSRSSDGRKGREKSRERRSDRSRSRRRNQRDRDGEVPNSVDELKKKAVKDANEIDKSEDAKKEKEVELKTSIWEKRTVGAVFEAALERYYQRKAAKGS